MTAPNFIAHLNLGQAFNGNHNLPEAEHHFFEALKILPDHECHKALATVLFEEGDFEEAFFHYSVALRMKPDYAETHASLANFFENCTNRKYQDRKRASYHAQRAYQLTKYRRKDFLVLLAGICANDKQYSKAIDAAQKAIEVSVSPQEIQESKSLMTKIHEMQSEKK